MPRAHITLTVEIEHVSPDRIDKRTLRRFLQESLISQDLTLWDAHVRAEIEPGGRVIELDLEPTDD